MRDVIITDDGLAEKNELRENYQSFTLRTAAGLIR